jgi:hypothetical protein
MDNMPGDGTPAETLPFLAPQNVNEYAARAQQGIPGSTDTVSAKYGNEDFALTRGAVTPDAVRFCNQQRPDIQVAVGY